MKQPDFPREITMVAVDPAALQALCDQVAALRSALERVIITPRPEWLTVDDYAKFTQQSRRTVLRRISEGAVELRKIGGKRMIRV